LEAARRRGDRGAITHGGVGGLAVVAAQVVADRRQALVCGRIGLEQFG
jgi:hypothetical protein